MPAFAQSERSENGDPGPCWEWLVMVPGCSSSDSLTWQMSHHVAVCTPGLQEIVKSVHKLQLLAV